MCLFFPKEYILTSHVKGGRRFDELIQNRMAQGGGGM